MIPGRTDNIDLVAGVGRLTQYASPGAGPVDPVPSRAELTAGSLKAPGGRIRSETRRPPTF